MRFALALFATLLVLAVKAGPNDGIWKARRSDGRCGPLANNAACRPDECCSSYGWCGTTANHCNSKSLWIGQGRNQIHFNSDNAPMDDTKDQDDLRFLAPSASVKAANWCGRRKVVALTFDDGPIIGGEYTQAILEDLKSAGIKATFFLSPQSPAAAENRNQNTQCQLLKRMRQDGHSVAGHTMRHPSLIGMSNAEIVKELDDYNRWYRNCVGHEPEFRALRPPFGELTAVQRNLINNHGETVISWNADSNDWQGGSAEALYQRTMNEFQAVVAQNGETSSII